MAESDKSLKITNPSLTQTLNKNKVNNSLHACCVDLHVEEKFAILNKGMISNIQMVT
jgi:hypothetical protein